MQIRGATDPAEQAPPIQLGGHRHRVGGLAAAVEVQDRVVDALMVGAVEVAGPEPLEHVGDGVLAQQHAAEHGLLGGLVLRRLATEVLGGRWNVVDTRMAAVIHDSHGVPPPLESSNVRSTSRYRDCKSDPRRAQPPRRRNSLATANARRCWRDRKGALFMDLWMECGYLRSARVEALGRTCGRTTASATSPQISGPQGWELVVDDKFIGVSGRVASSGVLCFGVAPRRLTAG